MKAQLTVLALLAAAALALGGATAGSAKHASSPGQPDAYVAAWDAVGIQAITTAGLGPPDAINILAYVGIAVYDSVVAIEGGYEPFAVDVHVPNASPQAAVAAAAHRVLVQYMPAQAA